MPMKYTEWLLLLGINHTSICQEKGQLPAALPRGRVPGDGRSPVAAARRACSYRPPRESGETEKSLRFVSEGCKRPCFHVWELWVITCGAELALCSWNAVNSLIAFIILIHCMRVIITVSSPGRN